MVTLDGNPWFVAADVCRTLGISNPSVAVRALGADEWAKANLAQRGMGSAITLSESGLYKLVMRSDKPEAKPFQDWVTKVVLPAIRKDGGYILGFRGVVRFLSGGTEGRAALLRIGCGATLSCEGRYGPASIGKCGSFSISRRWASGGKSP